MSDPSYSYLRDAGKAGRRPIGRRDTNPENLWWRRLLTRAERDPAVVLADERCRTPEFCDEYFELCDGKVLVEPWAAAEHAVVATRLAALVGDRHRTRRGLGVLVHSLVAAQDWASAAKVLKWYWWSTLWCCRVCRSDYYFRRGDFLVETRRAKAARSSLKKSLRIGRGRLDDDRVARVHFLLGIAHYQLGEPEQALLSTRETLVKMSLDSPRGYFLDTLAFVVVYLPVAGTSYDGTALETVRGFDARLAGCDDVADIRARISWVEGVLLVRLGDRKTGLRRLQTARTRVLKWGQSKDAVAVTLDQALVLSTRESNAATIATMIGTCLDHREDLAEEMRDALTGLRRRVEREPENAFEAIAALRSSFVADVPGRLAGVLRPPEAAAKPAGDGLRRLAASFLT